MQTDHEAFEQFIVLFTTSSLIFWKFFSNMAPMSISKTMMGGQPYMRQLLEEIWTLQHFCYSVPSLILKLAIILDSQPYIVRQMRDIQVWWSYLQIGAPILTRQIIKA